MKFNAKMVVIGLIICVCIAVTALIVSKGTVFSGADDAASDVSAEILEVAEYDPWASPF